MKKIIIGFMLFFNFGITISNHQATVNVGAITYAQQHQGDVSCPHDVRGNGADPNWWDRFTTWLHDLYIEIISSIGEIYDDEIGGSQIYGSNYLYPWGTGNAIPYIDVYYNGYGTSYFETPSIYGGPYRSGRMMNSSNGTSTYIDCAFLEHNTSASGISGRSNEIAYLDECNECVGGSTGLPPCSSPLYYLQTGDNTKYYNGDTITVDPSSSIWLQLKLTLYNEHGVTPSAVSWESTSNNVLYFDWPWDIGNSYNVVVNTIGDYTITVYEGSLLAHSTISTNHLQVRRTDTVKPTPVPCITIDSLAPTRDSIATNMLNQIATSPELIRTRDSAQGIHETSFSTNDSAGYTKVYPGSFKVGNFAGVPIYANDTVTGANHKNLNSIWHLHQKGADPFPDPADLFNLMMTRTLRGYTGVYGIFNGYNPYLNHSFIVCGDTLIDLAVVIYDTALAYQYINLNRKDTVVELDSLGPKYSSTYKGLTTHSVPSLNISMGEDFDNAYRALKRMHYPDKLANTYAGIYMMQRYNMGIKTLMKVNGAFKELKITDVTYRRDGTIRTIKVKICE